jgi:hypothetical protein
METMFSLCVTIVSILLGCIFGFWAFIVFFILGVIVQRVNSRSRRIEKEKAIQHAELMATLRCLKPKE